MNCNDIISARLSHQQLTVTRYSTPEGIVGYMGAVQAQDYAAAKWATGLRLQDSTDSDMESAFNQGTILRTHVMRPTWHFVAPQDIRWLLKLTAPRVHAFNAYMYRKMDVDDAVFKKSSKLLSKSLKGNNFLTRPDIEVIFNKAGIATDDVRMVCIMMHAELDGLICSGPRIGKQFSYALLEERVPAVKEISKDEGLARLTELYFTSRGPATLQDYIWWSGLTAAECRGGLAMMKSKLQHDVIDGQEYWSAIVLGKRIEKADVAFLLPNFDEYSVAYKDRGVMFDAKKIKHEPGPMALLGNIIILNGQVAGVWKRTIKKDRVDLALNFYHKITKAQQKEIDVAIEKYSQFIGLPVIKQ
ncbi:MAG: hypothetical protein JWQ38_2565 [Flavipsychrobacter sp.]|nr:hypothetical protein [Flavipsychrobacter sp.]